MAGVTGDGTFDVERNGRSWKVVAVGGSTAYGLVNQESRTGAGRAIIEALDGSSGQKELVVLMFGEIDCAEHVARRGMTALEPAIDRLRQFETQLSSRPDVCRVVSCLTLPHTRNFYSQHGDLSERVRLTSESWNRMIPGGIDIYSPLLDTDGFMHRDFAYNWDDTGERHLNGRGYDHVWAAIERYLV